jgi:hypothetical protein
MYTTYNIREKRPLVTCFIFNAHFQSRDEASLVQRKTAMFVVTLTNTLVDKISTCGEINADTVSWLHKNEQRNE